LPLCFSRPCLVLLLSRVACNTEAADSNQFTGYPVLLAAITAPLQPDSPKLLPATSPQWPLIASSQTPHLVLTKSEFLTIQTFCPARLGSCKLLLIRNLPGHRLVPRFLHTEQPQELGNGASNVACSQALSDLQDQ
jgi:hypothetical protein